MIEKFQGRTCPKCGEVYSSFEIVKVELGPALQVNLCCENNHKWSEFYILTYQGFWWDGKLYDSYGQLVNKE